jgi:hypothetical protein
VANAAKKLPSFHERRDLPKKDKTWATVCLALEDIETLVVTL